MSKQLTPEEIEQLRIWHMAESPARLHRVAQRRIVDYMLRLHDERERLRNLQPEDVTGAQIQAAERKVGECHTVWDRVREGDLIAAAVRVIAASLDNPADSA